MLCDKIIFNLKCLLIEFIVPNLSLINFCILKLVLEYKITFGIRVLVQGYCLVKKLV
jgi:hypothetical protein